MIDNFNILSDFMPTDDSHFCHLSIIRRNKDFNDNESHNHFFKSYMVKSSAHLFSLKDEIITLCETFQARAYLSPEQKSFKTLQDMMLVALAQYNADDTVASPYKIIDATADKIKTDVQKYFIVDVDCNDDLYRYVETTIQSIHAGNGDISSIYPVKTPNGKHLITVPFNTALFYDKLNNEPTIYQILQKPSYKSHTLEELIEIKKHSQGTLLYYPNSLESKK